MAIQLMESAIAANPAAADYHNNLGVILASQNRNDAAVEAYRKAIALKPNYPEAYYNLGIALTKLNRLEESADAFRRSIDLKPGQAGCLNGLSLVFRKLGKSEEAVEFSRRALKLDPDNAEFQYNICIALVEAGRRIEALDVCRGAIERDPRNVGAMNNAGNILRELGRLDEAIYSYRQAIALEPEYAEAHHNLGNAPGDMGRIDKAISSYRQAIRIKPDYAEAHGNLGNALKGMGQLDDAFASFRQAIRLKPDLADVHNNFGNALKDIGRLDEAIAEFRQAIRLNPNFASAHSNLVLALLYHPGFDAGMIREELCRWNQQHAEPLKRFIQPHANNRDPDRRLRIGYVSPDFRDHVVGQNLLPLLRGHDHGQMEIFCYADVVRADAITEQFKRRADSWRSIVGMSDSELADQIRQDRIDILVDLALHTGSNRLGVFARKPAPVQATFAGYPGSTGLETIDYRLTDPYLDPPGLNDHFYSETSLRLPDSFWCYDPPFAELAGSTLPAQSRGFITFGCLNNFCKVNEPVSETLGAGAQGRRSIAIIDALSGRQSSPTAPGPFPTRGNSSRSRRVGRTPSPPAIFRALSPDRCGTGYVPLQRPHHQPRIILDGRSRGNAGRQNRGWTRRAVAIDQSRIARIDRPHAGAICANRRRPGE